MFDFYSWKKQEGRSIGSPRTQGGVDGWSAAGASGECSLWEESSFWKGVLSSLCSSHSYKSMLWRGSKTLFHSKNYVQNLLIFVCRFSQKEFPPMEVFRKDLQVAQSSQDSIHSSVPGHTITWKNSKLQNWQSGDSFISSYKAKWKLPPSSLRRQRAYIFSHCKGSKTLFHPSSLLSSATLKGVERSSERSWTL